MDRRQGDQAALSVSSAEAQPATPDADASGVVAVGAAVVAALADLAPGAPLVLGVSGGLDSLVLLEAVHRQARWRPLVYHLDHGLRPEAAADAAFVAATAAACDLPCIVERAAVADLARGRRQGLEATGRIRRRQGLSAAAQRHGAAVVLTAHHADDQAETVLHNLLRGAGPTGLAGMPPRLALGAGIEQRRPLLTLPRRVLAAAADTWALRWREDASNRDPRFTRNRLRHAVLPVLEGGCPGFTVALLGFAAEQAAEHRRLEAALDAWWPAPRPARLPLAPLASAPRALRWQAWRRWLRSHGLACDRRRLHRIDDLAGGARGRRLGLGRHRLRKERGALVIVEER